MIKVNDSIEIVAPLAEPALFVELPETVDKVKYPEGVYRVVFKGLGDIISHHNFYAPTLGSALLAGNQIFLRERKNNPHLRYTSLISIPFELERMRYRAAHGSLTYEEVNLRDRCSVKALDLVG